MLVCVQVAYYGRSRDVGRFLSGLGLHCDATCNPADFIGQCLDPADPGPESDSQ